MDLKTIFHIRPYCRTSELYELKRQIHSEFFFLYSGTTQLQLSPNTLERMQQVACDSQAVMLYSDYYTQQENKRFTHPTINYQKGSLRDDFDFGPLWLIRTSAFLQAIDNLSTDYQYAALYALRLHLSRQGEIIHLPEYLYTIEDADSRKSGEKQFDYVNPKNREVQLEMEAACTEHLKAIGGWLPPVFQDIDLNKGTFPVEASIIIPVRNRAKTIADAIRSALQQQTDFPYNIIVVDNHSNDGTTEIIHNLLKEHPQVVHLYPTSTLLGIGGCWNEAIQSPHCGRFAVQLDSDDLYNTPHTLQTIIDNFYQQQCAMLIGSYQMVNFALEEIPPGLIDHREWTPDNGRNNALRINGLGAPRAFYTPLIRTIKFPNVSYGEDYAVGLAISRHYRIGRIYQPLYLCRRWDGNSDASLEINKLNTYNTYKDTLRSIELSARMKEIKQYGK